MSDDSLRLNKHLALQLGVSRREADNLIEQGRVRIDGQVATLGARISPTAELLVNNQPIATDTTKVYIAFNKPTGYVCSRKAQGDAPTIYELLPSALHALKPVGRLDKDSSGIILLTNDGDFTYEMTHPKFYKQKSYEVQLDTELAPLHQQMINDYGVTLEDGPSKLSLERLSDTNRTDWTVRMHEGRNRQIRRTFAALGYTVTRLHRTEFGHYRLGSLAPGQHRVIEK